MFSLSGAKADRQLIVECSSVAKRERSDAVWRFSFERSEKFMLERSDNQRLQRSNAWGIYKEKQRKGREAITLLFIGGGTY
jgi:hypothetical protein